MSKEIINPTPETVPRSNGNHNIKNNAALIVSCCSLFFAMMSFLIGTDFVSKYLKPSATGNDTFFEGVIALLNIVLAIYVLLDLKIIRPVNPPDDDSYASGSFKQLLFGWQMLWFIWILLYIFLAAEWLLNLSKVAPTLSNPFRYAAEFFNMVNGFYFYYLFFILDQRSVATKAKPKRAKVFHQNLKITFGLGVIAFIVLVIASAVATFYYQKKVQEVGLVLKLVAAYTALGMVFFFGRLDSHYLKIPRIILAPLYLYALIQLFWGSEVFIPGFNSERIVVFTLALVLKFVIFLRLSEWIRDGIFHQYLIDAEQGFGKESEG